MGVLAQALIARGLGGSNMVCEFTVGEFKAFVKICGDLLPLCSSMVMELKDSCVTARTFSESGTITCDMSTIMYSGVHLSFRLLKTFVSKLKKMDASYGAVVTDDGEGYWFITGYDKAYVEMSRPDLNVMVVDEASLTTVGQVVDGFKVDNWKNIIKREKVVSLLMYSGQLEGIRHASGERKFFNKLSGIYFDRVAPDLVLSSRTFLGICGKEVEIKIAKEDDIVVAEGKESFWLIFKTEVNYKTKVHVYEKLEVER